MKTSQLRVSIALLCFALAACNVPGFAQTSEQDKTEKTSLTDSGKSRDDVVAVQALLDRAGFSPGEIDGLWGKNVRQAMAVFQQTNNLPVTDEPDDATVQALKKAAGGEAFIEYRITDEDVAGPFTPEIPKELPDQAKLDALGFRNLAEALGEKFHIKPELLESLNKQVELKAGKTIRVPNVTDDPPATVESVAPTETNARGKQESSSADEVDKRSEKDGKDADNGKAAGTDDRSDNKPAGTDEKSNLVVTVSKTSSTLTVSDSDRVVFHAPVTSGSEHDPLPLGEWRVTAVARNPSFNYNPDLFWDAKEGHEKAKIPPGPNNPVGRAWIDLNKEHYGIHGTPEPGKIGYTESHGCVRLTNWDVTKLAGIVKKGTQVLFVE